MGVGLHPICLAAYEWMHLGRCRSLGLLTRAGIAALVLLELLELSLKTLPWLVPILAHALITAGWVKLHYKPRETGNLPAIHRRGLAIAIAAYIPILILQWRL